MIVKAIATRKFLPPKDDLLSLIKESFLNIKLKEETIIIVTSKIVSIWQGRCIKISDKVNKDELVKREADFYISRDQVPNKVVMLTIKDNILIPMAGIDESNANGYYILWPKDPFEAAKEINDFIKKTYKLKNLGIIISDSHTTPQRNGIVGIGIAYHGFYPLRDYRGTKDIFGRALKMTQTNIVDSLASSAVFEMGEGAEQTPIAIIEDVKDIKFGNFNERNLLIMDKDADIYAPLIKSIKWKKYR